MQLRRLNTLLNLKADEKYAIILKIILRFMTEVQYDNNHDALYDTINIRNYVQSNNNAYTIVRTEYISGYVEWIQKARTKSKILYA